jgi:hypothetical protein
MREERERGARSAIPPHRSLLSLAPHRGCVCSPPHQVHALILRSQGGNRGLERLGGGPVVEETAAARAKFSL